MKTHAKTLLLVLGLALGPGCSPLNTGDDDGSSGVDDGGATENRRRVGQLTVTQITFVPPAHDPVLSFLDAVFWLPDPDRPDNPDYIVETVGECTIFTHIGEDWSGPAPEHLDAGEQGTASVGDTTIELRIRDGQSHHYSPDYSSDSPIELGFEAGATVVFDFPGGEDIAAFSSGIDMPANLVLLTTSLMEGTHTYESGSDFEVEWEPDKTEGDTGGEMEARVRVYLSATNGLARMDGATDGVDGVLVVISCGTEYSGSFTIPANIMARLPDREPDSPFSGAVSRVHVTSVDVELAGGETGTVWIEGIVEVPIGGSRPQ